MWDDGFVIQRMSDKVEFAVTYSIPDAHFAEELWICAVDTISGLSFPQTLPGGYLTFNPRFYNPMTVSKRCKVIGRSQRDCILEWAGLNPEKISLFFDRLAVDPKWQIYFRGLYNSLCLLHLRIFNREARVVELMEIQLMHRIELLLVEERLCLERHEQELAVRKARVLYLELVTADSVTSEFKERTGWRSKLPALPQWPSRRKSNKKRARVDDGSEPALKRKCNTRSKVADVFTSGATAALFP